MAMTTSASGSPAAVRRPRRPILLWAISALVALLLLVALANAFLTPPAHEVHTPGGIALSVHRFDSIPGKVSWSPGPPTQNLAQVGCSRGAPYQPDPTCNASDANIPSLKQTPQTLYVVWAGCADWSGAGAIIQWQGYNVEYLSSNQSLVFHCYTAKPWVYVPDRLYGVVAYPQYALIAVPTAVIGLGPVTIVEDDRLEHLIGDQSTQTQLATTTIS
jgi:hypothetical protein